MKRPVFSPVTQMAALYFSTLPHKRNDFLEKVI